jgi:hypothetical protein
MTSLTVDDLARDLKVRDEDLVRELVMMGFAVEGPESSLETDDPVALRAQLLTVLPQREVVEHRIKPTVIRRIMKRQPSEEQAQMTAEPASTEIAGQEPHSEEKKKQMEQFDRLMDFVRETREIQQKYLETIRSENEKQIENVRQENLRLIGKMEESLRREFSGAVSDLKTFTNQRLETLEGFYRNTQFTLILGIIAIIISMWAPFLMNLR